MLATVLTIAGVVVALFTVVVALQAPTFRVARSAKMAAPPSVLFAQVNDFRNWPAWSPWEKLDPAMQRSYEGPSAGAGAVYSWVGNKNVGEGRATIVESRPNELVRLKLEFLKPFVATNEALFTFEPAGNETVVTWSMTGTKNFMFKAFHLIMNVDKMCGGQFEQGLASLNEVATAPSGSPALQHA